jgi:hypothetical protein
MPYLAVLQWSQELDAVRVYSNARVMPEPLDCPVAGITS